MKRLTKPEIVILIKSKELAETYRSNFEVLWKQAKSSSQNQG